MKITITKLEQGYTTTLVTEEIDEEGKKYADQRRRAWEQFEDVLRYVEMCMEPATPIQQLPQEDDVE